VVFLQECLSNLLPKNNKLSGSHQNDSEAIEMAFENLVLTIFINNYTFAVIKTQSRKLTPNQSKKGLPAEVPEIVMLVKGFILHDVNT